MKSMSRAALLPTPGDPYLLAYFLHFFKTVWYNEINRLYIYYNSPIEDEVVRAMYDLCNDPKIRFIYCDHHNDHGPSIDRMLEECTEEYVMLIEDDGLIFKPGIVDECFKELEEDRYDVVGSARGSCALPIIERGKQVWGTDEHGPNFWPNFLFIKKEKLLLTDRNFAAKAWYRGDRIGPLDMVVDEDVMYGDTFVNTSLQLRAMGLRIKLVNQYHLNIDDEVDAVKGVNVFDGEARWLHIGSMSSGVSGFLVDDRLKPLSRRWEDATGNEKLPDYCHNDQEKMELERRVSFWMLAYQCGSQGALDDKFPSFEFEYARAIERLITHYNLNRKRISRRVTLYKDLGL